MERYLGWLLVAARLLVTIVFLLNGFGIIDQTIPAREMLERGVPSGCIAFILADCRDFAVSRPVDQLL